MREAFLVDVSIYFGERRLFIHLRNSSYSVFEILPTTWEDLRVCGRERLIPVCSVTETGLNIEIFHVAGWHNMGLDVRKPVFGGFRTTKA